MPNQPAPTVEIPKRLPLILEPENRGDSVSFDARLVNGYVETKKLADGMENWIYQRPGLTQYQRPSGGNATGRGIFNWLGNIYSIFGATLYKDGVAVVGAVDTTNGVYRFDQCLGATPKMQLGNGVKGYNYDAGAGLVVIGDAQFPASFVKGWAYLDGTTYVMTPTAHIQGSDLNDPTSWDALNDILAQIEPDQGKALAKQLVYVVALKQWTGEVFYDAGNAAASPLGRVEGAKFNWGCMSADSVRDLDGDIIWLGKSRYGSPEVLFLQSVKATSVSTKAVERLLGAATISTETIYSWVANLSGHKFYVLTLVNKNLTLAYDVEEKLWCQWTDASGNYLPIVSSCTTDDGVTLVQHATNGRIYTFLDSAVTDDGEIIQVDLYTPNWDGGVRKTKFMSQLEVIADRKVGADMQIRTNDMDYDAAGWSNFRSVDLSLDRLILPDCGSFFRRAHNLRFRSGKVRMPRIQAIALQMDLGTI